MNYGQYLQGSLAIDFGSLSRALGFGNGSVVSFGSAGSVQFSSLGGS
ncbi:hypothetical protein [Rhodococcus sp. IEGM 1379]|nr:hypothetical protein [Rhodococcus sp. IEGM 1379]MDI9916875.1 hypothetical protein [Rhodococcus sp. IEGM 1379]